MKHRHLKFERGCRVAYAREFLRNTSQFTGPSAPTSSGPFARGSVVEVEPFHGSKSLIRIHWDDGHISSVLDSNLVHVDRIHLEAV